MKKTIIACCCKTCGNCTKAPTFDNRENCCCHDCGHCFKMPQVVYQYWPYYHQQSSIVQPLKWTCYGTTTTDATPNVWANQYQLNSSAQQAIGQNQIAAMAQSWERDFVPYDGPNELLKFEPEDYPVN